jgi:hypothetical protein
MSETLHNKNVLADLEDGIAPLDFLGYDIT